MSQESEVSIGTGLEFYESLDSNHFVDDKKKSGGHGDHVKWAMFDQSEEKHPHEAIFLTLPESPNPDLFSLLSTRTCSQSSASSGPKIQESLWGPCYIANPRKKTFDRAGWKDRDEQFRNDLADFASDQENILADILGDLEEKFSHPGFAGIHTTPDDMASPPKVYSTKEYVQDLTKPKKPPTQRIWKENMYESLSRIETEEASIFDLDNPNVCKTTEDIMEPLLSVDSIFVSSPKKIYSPNNELSSCEEPSLPPEEISDEPSLPSLEPILPPLEYSPSSSRKPKPTVPITSAKSPRRRPPAPPRSPKPHRSSPPPRSPIVQQQQVPIILRSVGPPVAMQQLVIDHNTNTDSPKVVSPGEKRSRAEMLFSKPQNPQKGILKKHRSSGTVQQIKRRHPNIIKKNNSQPQLLGRKKKSHSPARPPTSPSAGPSVGQRPLKVLFKGSSSSKVRVNGVHINNMNMKGK